jgi:hypothetical protein
MTERGEVIMGWEKEAGDRTAAGHPRLSYSSMNMSLLKEVEMFISRSWSP